ncbi:hypothetical protein ACFO3O_01585 [Dokdonia ponticola]|uniref:DUF4136 domain-containing protein n=1 Tax=Dokdonia ponticola TaxID=2041041 RepID=A0ABV9HRX4_9FLAO
MRITTITFLIIFYFSTSCVNDEKEVITQFYKHINNIEYSKAKSITTDDFLVKYVWEDKSLNRENYFNRLLKGKAIKPKLDILELKKNKNYFDITYKTSSLFNKFLSIPELEYQTKIYLTEKQIREIQIDTLTGYNEASLAISDGWSSFHNWFIIKHPEANLDEVNKNYNNLLVYLEEYYNK